MSEISEKEKRGLITNRIDIDDLSIERLRVFEDHIKRKIDEKVREAIKRELFFDPRDDEMMSEIYPDG